jgi:hypothetical protein
VLNFILFRFFNSQQVQTNIALTVANNTRSSPTKAPNATIIAEFGELLVSFMATDIASDAVSSLIEVDSYSDGVDLSVVVLFDPILLF